MSKKIFVDTSAWIGLFSQEDLNHKRALEIWNKLKQDKAALFTSDYIVAETINLVSKTAVMIGTGSALVVFVRECCCE